MEFSSIHYTIIIGILSNLRLACLGEQITIKYCEGYNSLNNNQNKVLVVPASLSYNRTSIQFRLEEQKTKCTTATNEIKLNKNSNSPDGFTPSGYFKVGFHYYDPENYCILSETQELIVVSVCPVNCNKTVCIPKCCPPDEVEDIEHGKCTYAGERRWSPILHYSDTLERLTDEAHAETRPHYIESKVRCTPEIEQGAPYVGRHIENKEFSKKDIRLLKNGTLTFKLKGSWKAISQPFCLDGIQNYGKGKYHTGDDTDFIVLKFAHCDDNHTSNTYADEMEQEIQDSRVITIVNDVHAGLMLFSCLFLILTIVVYVLLWEKQNIHGWTITSYVASLTSMYIFIASFKLIQNSDMGIEVWFCVPNAILAHFFFLSTFSWLTVINFDIWWTFRDMKPNPMKSAEIKRYILYFGFAVGFPLFVIALGQIIQYNQCDLDSGDCNPTLVAPNYGKMSCFLHRKAEGPYLYYLISALLVFNAIFFLSTTFVLYRHYRATKRVHDTPGNQSIESIRVLAKLFIVMGVTWIFDFVSWCFTNPKTAIYFSILDCINILQAVAIFFIFVFKRQILTQLWNKYPALRPVLLPMKQLPCCQRKSFDFERTKSTKTTMERERLGSRKDSLANSRKDSLTTSRKDSMDKSFETVEL